MLPGFFSVTSIFECYIDFSVLPGFFNVTGIFQCYIDFLMLHVLHRFQCYIDFTILVMSQKSL